MSLKDSGFDFNKIDELGGFRGDLDPEFLVRLQTNRCAIAQSTGDSATFNGSVMALLGLIPMEKRAEIDALKTDPDRGYIKYGNKWTPKTYSGWVLSDDPYNPTITNEPRGNNYDSHYMSTRYEERENKETGEKMWVKIVERGGIHWISPTREEDVENIDYYRLFILIQEKLQEAGLSWHMQRLEVFTGEQWDPAFAEEEEEDATNGKPEATSTDIIQNP